MSTVAERVKLHRERAKLGVVIAPTELDARWPDYLVRAGLLDPNLADDRCAILDAYQRFTDAYIKLEYEE